ncbi:uncharacterized protein CDAR_545331, partial [Caerostris darwini]
MPVRVSFQIIQVYQDSGIICCLNTYFLSRRFMGEIFRPMSQDIKIKDQKFLTTFYEVETEPKKVVPPVKCIGREDEKEEITQALTELKDKIEQLEEKFVPLFLIIGKIGMGKTTLLEWSMRKAEEIGIKLASQVDNQSFEESYENAWKIIEDILHKSGNDSDDKILNLIDNKTKEFPLHKLNKRMNTE